MIIGQSKRKIPFERAKEIELRANSILSLDSVIGTASAEMCYKDYYFETRQDISKKTQSFCWYSVFAINSKHYEKMPIGVFTLQLVDNERVIFRIPPRSQWGKGNFSPIELITMGLIDRQDDAVTFYNELFVYFINKLDSELKHYGLKKNALWYVWQWIKSHKLLSSIIAVVISAITLLGTNWNIVVENFIKLLKWLHIVPGG